MMQKGKISNGVTRRKFFRRFLKAGAVIVVGVSWGGRDGSKGRFSRGAQRNGSPRKFVRAIRFRKYPGSLKPLPNIYEQSKWRG